MKEGTLFNGDSTPLTLKPKLVREFLTNYLNKIKITRVTYFQMV